MNSLDGILNALNKGVGEIFVSNETIKQANISLERMLNFTKKNV